MATVKGTVGDLGGPLPEGGHGEVAKYLVCRDNPGVGDEVCPCVRDDENVPEHV